MYESLIRVKTDSLVRDVQQTGLITHLNLRGEKKHSSYSACFHQEAPQRITEAVCVILHRLPFLMTRPKSLRGRDQVHPDQHCTSQCRGSVR